jgi:hypothetical protein
MHVTFSESAGQYSPSAVSQAFLESTILDVLLIELSISSTLSDEYRTSDLHYVTLGVHIT